MIPDALAACVARSSAPMIFAFQIQVFVLHEEEFHLPVLLVWRNGINCWYIFMFPMNSVACKGLNIHISCSTITSDSIQRVQ